MVGELNRIISDIDQRFHPEIILDLEVMKPATLQELVLRNVALTQASMKLADDGRFESMLETLVSEYRAIHQQAFQKVEPDVQDEEEQLSDLFHFAKNFFSSCAIRIETVRPLTEREQTLLTEMDTLITMIKEDAAKFYRSVRHLRCTQHFLN